MLREAGEAGKARASESKQLHGLSMTKSDGLAHCSKCIGDHANVA
jgi:hypothetical protein